MNIVNLTPHPITLRSPTKDTTIASTGVARVKTTPGQELPGGHEPCTLFSGTSYGEVEGLPEPTDGTIFVVSGLVAGRLQNRPDVFSPGTGPQDGAVRNEQGHIVAVTRLIRSC